jgi:hypothetical protein
MVVRAYQAIVEPGIDGTFWSEKASSQSVAV